MRLSNLGLILMPLLVCRACTCFPDSSDNGGCEADTSHPYVPIGGYGGGHGGGGGELNGVCAAAGGSCVFQATCPSGTYVYVPSDCDQGLEVCCVPGVPDGSTNADGAAEAGAGDAATDAVDELTPDAEEEPSSDAGEEAAEDAGEEPTEDAAAAAD